MLQSVSLKGQRLVFLVWDAFTSLLYGWYGCADSRTAFAGGVKNALSHYSEVRVSELGEL